MNDSKSDKIILGICLGAELIIIGFLIFVVIGLIFGFAEFVSY